jgi:hypothetical protein
MATIEKQAALRFIDPKRPSIRERIVETLQKCNGRGLTAKELAVALSVHGRHGIVKVNTVTGRIDELWDEGTIHGVTSKGAETRYRITAPKEVGRVSEARRKEKFHVWLRKGRERYGNVITDEVWNEMFKVATVQFS